MACTTDTTDFIESIPYFNEDDEFPCMYAGTVNTDGSDHNLFYWLFKNTASTEELPLIIWLNGGPGSSSMFGLFLENGPLRINRTGTTDEDYLVYLNPEGSWLESGHLLFVDQPVDTGFSYGSPPVQQMQTGADEFVILLRDVYNTHPEFQDLDLYITGESYAGKYIPIFAETIIDQNAAAEAGDFIIPLAGIAMGDPYTSPGIQRVRTPSIAQGLDLIDDYQMDQIDVLQRKCEEAVSTN
mmetsp:Transcript_21700/g.20805  ORF Transcript_21700/g.20805 Transcript_21700/m.20805 type:complete len:241 (+) Transcript_21700:174-896(+)